MKKQENFITITDSQVIEKLRQTGAWVEDGKELKLPMLEAVYFAEKKIIPEDFADILAKLKKTDNLAEEKYAVLRYLRNNGYITRVSLDTTEYLRVYQKGFRPGEDRTKTIVKVIPKDWSGNLEELVNALEFSGNLRKDLVFAYVVGNRVHFIKMGRTNFE